MSLPYSYNHPPATERVPTSPRRRQHPVQPPSLLTTSLGNARNAGLAIGGIAQSQTPVSTTSLSTPFSAYPQSPYPQSPGGAMRGTSPMNFRSPTSFPTAYNPQQWGPVSNTSPNSTTSGHGHQHVHSRVAALAPRLVGPDGKQALPKVAVVAKIDPLEPVASPPPPYSPRRNQEPLVSPLNAAETISPSDTTSPDTESSRYGTPVSAATTLSPDLYSRHPGSHTTAAQQAASANTSPNPGSAPSFPPPPSTHGSGSRVRSSSKNHADRLLSSLTSRNKGTGTSSTVHAIDTLQERTDHLLAQVSDTDHGDPALRAPAARRAASTGAIGFSGASSRTASHSPSPTTWEPGMPLPPPPPRPPPVSSRSQSLSRPAESPTSGLAPSLPLRVRRPPGTGTSLETVPPTPADWREEEYINQEDSSCSASKGFSPLHIDTGSILQRRRSGAYDVMSATAATPSHMRRDSSAGGLFRSPAVRNRSAKGIRERRSESRNGKGRAVEDAAVEPPDGVDPWDEDLDNIRPRDLVLPSAPMGPLNLRMNPRSTPKTGKSMQSLDGAMKSADQRLSSGKAVTFDSSRSDSTPLFSPARDSARETLPSATGTSPALPPSLLPTSPVQRSFEPPKALRLSLPLGPEERPISHLLHMPNPVDSMQVPLTPFTQASRRPVSDLLGPESPKAFSLRAVERHRKFAEREAAAANDSERLDLFVQFMVAESRIRRDQYAAVFEEEEVDVQDLMQGLFGQSTLKRDFGQTQGVAPLEDTSKRTSIASSALADSSSQDGGSSFSRKHESPSSNTTSSSAQNRPESGWMKDYVPCLSPIASMSIVTGQDEMDSRGRAPSRWWEDRSRSGDAGHGDAFNVLGRSKRESKYMGVPKEARDSPALYEPMLSGAGYTSDAQRQGGESSYQPSYGPNEYPPEKVGWHEGGQPGVPRPAQPPTPASAPYTPDPKRLDISRLVTLPPPYPRHHPAVNNSHPDLADSRAVVRSLHEKQEAESIRESYRSQILEKRQRADSWCEHQRSLHQQDVQFRIERGEITQSQYEEAEASLEEKIFQSSKSITQADFDLFQTFVVTPLHALISSRITLATQTISILTSQLFTTSQSHSPNLPQEEGDEQPELLEKLTQLKWLFEARETLHRQTYDLLSDRNSKYKAIVLLSYTHPHNPAKHADALSFFAKDACDRARAHDLAASSRATDFLFIIETNVSRGVESQLSAFWDIAPSLLKVLHKVPCQLKGFEIQIPQDEYLENESYYDHPLQYLYSLLGHAEKSTYQFIESQINLLCLLHEIRSCALTARCRVDANAHSDTAADDDDNNNAARQRETDVERMRQREERRLTADLKEKVGVVEGQWEEALGREIVEVRERVRGVLLEEGGWDDDGGEDV